MKLENIEVADISLIDTIIREREILFLFPKVFVIDKQEYVENCTLLVKDWKVFDAIAFIAESSTTFKRIILDFNQLEKFDLVQDISRIDENSFVIRGYSRESNKWLEYSFMDCIYEFLVA